MFLYSPAQIGAACVWLASREFEEKEKIDNYFCDLFKEEKGLFALISNTIAAAIETQSKKSVDKENARLIYNKLKAFGPFFIDPTSGRYRFCFFPSGGYC
jgi:hypothetical protein